MSGPCLVHVGAGLEIRRWWFPLLSHRDSMNKLPFHAFSHFPLSVHPPLTFFPRLEEAAFVCILNIPHLFVEPRVPIRIGPLVEFLADAIPLSVSIIISSEELTVTTEHQPQPSLPAFSMTFLRIRGRFQYRVLHFGQTWAVPRGFVRGNHT